MDIDQKKTVLLVEDEVNIALANKKDLEQNGYIVLSVNRGKDAVSLFKDSNNIDLVLMDIDLGAGMNGVQAASLILTEKDIPIVFMFSNSEPESVKKTDEINSYGYIEKSSNASVLDSSIKMAFRLFEAHKKEQTIESIIENTKILFWIFDGNNYIYANKNWFDFTGQTPGSSPTIESWLAAVHPADVEQSGNIWKDNWNNKTEHDNFFRLKRYDGIFRDFYCHASPVFNTAGKFIYFQGFNIDITEQKHIEEESQKYQYYLSKAQEIGKIGTWELDIPNDILKWTNENYRIFGLPLETEINNELFQSFVHPDDRERINETWEAALISGSFNIEHRIIVDNRVKWIKDKAYIEFDEEGNPLMSIGFTQDITERKEAEEQIRHQLHDLKKSNILIKEQAEQLRDLSIHDELTGLYNRRFFKEQVVIFHANAQRYDRPLTVVLGDIDFFKKINDTFSHLIGDRVLVKVSEIIGKGLRSSDIVARFGGEEIIMALPETESETALSIVERIRLNLEEYSWFDIADGLKLTMSFGMCSDYTLSSFREMVAIADKNLYTAKENGRNMVIADIDRDNSMCEK